MAERHRTDDEDISEYVVKSFLIVNGSKQTKVARDFCIIESILDKGKYFCGSVVEGTDLPGSDIDYMVVKNYKIVICEECPNDDKLQDFKKRHCNIFIPETSECKPGYARLKCIWRENEPMIEDLIDRKYLSSTEQFKALDGIKNRCRNGPSIRITNDSDYDDIEQDFVSSAIACDKWPQCLNEWIQRERKSKWPSSKLISKIKECPCHYVPKGDDSSIFFDTEWRLSVILGERELVWNLNDTQIICFVILKKMRLNLFEKKFPEQLTSYHLKNVIFWLSEELGLESWNPGNLISRIDDCLSYLIDRLEKHFLPHYFQRERNLLLNKMSSKTVKEGIINLLKEIRNNLIDVVIVHCKPEENSSMSKIWRAEPGNTSNLLYKCKQLENRNSLLPIRENSALYLTTYAGIRRILTIFFCNGFTTSGLEKVAKKLRNDVLIIDPCLRIQVWKIVNLIIAHGTGFPHKTSINVIEFKEVGSFDSVTWIVYLASFLVSSKQYQLALNELTSVLLRGESVFHCDSQSKSFYQINFGYHTELKDFNSLGYAFDYVMSMDFMHFAPYPIQLECVLQNWKPGIISLMLTTRDVIHIHPKSVFFFLLYLSKKKLGKIKESDETLYEFQQFVDMNRDGLASYRELNLLGYCYFLSNRDVNALECFKQSIEQTRQKIPNLQNAAVIHVALLIFNIYKSSKPDEHQNI